MVRGRTRAALRRDRLEASGGALPTRLTFCALRITARQPEAPLPFTAPRRLPPRSGSSFLVDDGAARAAARFIASDQRGKPFDLARHGPCNGGRTGIARCGLRTTLMTLPTCSGQRSAGEFRCILPVYFGNSKRIDAPGGDPNPAGHAPPPRPAASPRTAACRRAFACDCDCSSVTWRCHSISSRTSSR